MHVLNALHSTDLKEVNHIIAYYPFGASTTRKWVSSHYHVLFWMKPEKKDKKRIDAEKYQERLKVEKERLRVEAEVEAEAGRLAG